MEKDAQIKCCNISMLEYASIGLLPAGLPFVLFKLFPLGTVCWIGALVGLLGAALWKKQISSPHPLSADFHGAFLRAANKFLA